MGRFNFLHTIFWKIIFSSSKNNNNVKRGGKIISFNIEGLKIVYHKVAMPFHLYLPQFSTIHILIVSFVHIF